MNSKALRIGIALIGLAGTALLLPSTAAAEGRHDGGHTRFHAAREHHDYRRDRDWSWEGGRFEHERGRAFGYRHHHRWHHDRDERRYRIYRDYYERAPYVPFGWSIIISN